MVEFNRKKTYRRYIYSPLTLLLLFLVLLVLLKAVWGVYTKERISAANLKREQAELARLTDRKNELANSINFLKTEAGVENEVRSKFRVVKEGESVAVIVGNEDAATTTATSTPQNFFSRYFGFFGF